MPATPLPPGTASTGYYISDEDPFAGTAAQFDGLLFDVDVPDATAPGGFVSRSVTGAQLRAFLEGGLAPDLRPGITKFVRCLDTAQPGYTAGDTYLLHYPETALVMNQWAVVEFYPGATSSPTVVRAVYDPAPRAGTVGLRAFQYSDLQAFVPVRWVLATDKAAGIPAYLSLPSGYSFIVDELVRHYVADATTEQFFAAKLAGSAPPPTSISGDTYWRHVNAADVPAPGGGGVSAAQLEAVRTTAAQSATVASSYSLTLADAGNIVPSSSATPVTFTIPQYANVAFPLGTVIEIMQYGAGQVTVAGGTNVVLVAPTGTKTGGQEGSSVRLFQRALNTWVISGGIL
jgi:hypothetical protein